MRPSRPTAPLSRLALALAAVTSVGQAQPAAPPDGGVFRGALDADEPPAEVFERLQERMSRYCADLGPDDLRAFYRVSFQAHQFFSQRIEPEPRKKLYATYLKKLCQRFSAGHTGIGAAFPYPEIELFLVDVSTELCDLERGKPTPAVESALRQGGASRRIEIARAFCKRTAPFMPTSGALRAAFATSAMDEVCLDPQGFDNEAYPPLDDARRAQADALCERRAAGKLADLAAVEALWGPEPAPDDDDTAEPAQGAEDPQAMPTWVRLLAALAALLVVAAVARKLRARPRR